MPAIVYFKTGLMGTAALHVRGLHNLVNLRRDRGGGFRKKFTYPSSSPWVASMLAAFPVRTPLRVSVVGGRAVSKSEPPARACWPQSERLTINRSVLGSQPQECWPPSPLVTVFRTLGFGSHSNQITLGCKRQWSPEQSLPHCFRLHGSESLPFSLFSWNYPLV